jgi:hypothetical protein
MAKDKVVLVLPYLSTIPWRYTGSGNIRVAPPFLTSALDGVSGQLHAPVALPRWNRHCTHLTGGWVDLRAGLDAMEKRKPWTCRESNRGRPARRYTYWAIPAPNTRGRDEKCVGVLVGNPDRKRPFRRQSYKWDNNIDAKLKGIGDGVGRV